MSEWKRIEEAPATYADEEPVKLIVWIADAYGPGKGDFTLGNVYIGRRTGERRPKAAGYLGDYTITHFMLPTPPQQGQKR